MLGAFQNKEPYFGCLRCFLLLNGSSPNNTGKEFGFYSGSSPLFHIITFPLSPFSSHYTSLPFMHTHTSTKMALYA